MCSLLFVYGTLSPDLTPHELLPFVNRLREVGEASISGVMYDLGEYPGVIQPPDHGVSRRVFGRLYELGSSSSEAEALLAKFDQYEGVDTENSAASLFVRRKVRASLKSGEDLDCWVYLYNRPTESAKEISNGIYSGRSRR